MNSDILTVRVWDVSPPNLPIGQEGQLEPNSGYLSFHVLIRETEIDSSKDHSYRGLRALDGG